MNSYLESFEPAKGEQLDKLALLVGLTRKRWLFFFKERDMIFRKRVYYALTCPPLLHFRNKK